MPPSNAAGSAQPTATRETIPYHLIWIGLSLVYGYVVWRPRELAIMVAVTAMVTGAIMLHHALSGRIDWLETAEVPLSVILIAVIAAHIRRRHLALAELATAADDDRRQAEMRQHLMRQISHELRTPITVARGYTELLRERHIDAATAEQTTIVLDELDKSADITRRLITMIQIDGPYAPEPVDLDAELARIVRRWTPTADRIWQTFSTPGQVYVNRNRLEAALDGSVALSVGKVEADLSSEVIDSPAPVASADVGVRRLPVPAGGDRRRGALVSAVQSVLLRR